MNTHRAGVPVRRNQPQPARERNHVESAQRSRQLAWHVLDGIAPRGSGKRRSATQETRVALAVLALTFGWSKSRDTIVLRNIAELTGYTEQTTGRILKRMRQRGWLLYTPAVRGQRPGVIELPPLRDTTDRPPASSNEGRLPVKVVTTSTRDFIRAALGATASASLSRARIALALIASLPTWLRLGGLADCQALAEATGLDRKTVGRRLKDLAADGALTYTPGRGRGRHGHVQLNKAAPPDEELVIPDARSSIAPGESATPCNASRQRSPLSGDASGTEAALELPLRTEQRARVNALVNEVLDKLDRQSNGQSGLVVRAFRNMHRHNEVGLMLDRLIVAGYADEAVAALTHQIHPDVWAYRYARNISGAIYDRVRKCFHDHPDAVAGRRAHALSDVLNSAGNASARTLTAILLPTGAGD